jgi:hypothetical protein
VNTCLDVSTDISLSSVTDGLLCWRFTTQHLALDAVGPSTPTRLLLMHATLSAHGFLLVPHPPGGGPALAKPQPVMAGEGRPSTPIPPKFRTLKLRIATPLLSSIFMPPISDVGPGPMRDMWDMLVRPYWLEAPQQKQTAQRQETISMARPKASVGC